VTGCSCVPTATFLESIRGPGGGRNARRGAAPAETHSPSCRCTMVRSASAPEGHPRIIHRELAPFPMRRGPISKETSRTLKRYLAGRRVVDIPGPGGVSLPPSAPATCGHRGAGDGILATAQQ
jgi:hypothetical protein